MHHIVIEATPVTPAVDFNADSGTLSIMGRSLPEDVKSFYIPLVQWIDEYIKSPNPTTSLLLSFDYFNTASSKMLLIILNKFKELQRNGHQVQITWQYPSDDAELENAGQDFAELLNLPFKIEPINT
ncbi:MAG: DUF1987 domain-containing protein [Bacteroidales bacterium]|nr:DUF1987 domain-containing protein [Bacteroidales bacterium]